MDEFFVLKVFEGDFSRYFSRYFSKYQRLEEMLLYEFQGEFVTCDINLLLYSSRIELCGG